MTQRYLLMAACCLVASTAPASEGPPPILQPRAYRSASAEFSIHVNPSDLHGRGPAEYHFTRDGQTTWTNHFPFTLWEARVADSGHVAGYAYSHGWRGFAEGGYEAGMGTFSVVILSPEGRIVDRHEQDREHSSFFHTPPNPLAAGIVLNEHTRRFTIRVDDPDLNQGIEQWWVYDLKTGERVATLEPEPYMNETDASVRIVDAQAVPDSPLTIVHWWRYEDPIAGAVFTLVDPEAKPDWSLELHDDYTLPDDEKTQSRIRQRMREDGAILSVGKGPRFEVGCIREGKRVTFAVERKDDAEWAVREISGRDYNREPPSPPLRTRAMPSIELQHAGTIRLDRDGQPAVHPIRDIRSFDVDEKGRICFVRSSGNEGPDLVLVSDNGDILAEVSLRERTRENGTFCDPACVGDDTFVVAESRRDEDPCTRGYIVDFSAHSARVLGFPPGLSVDALTGFPDQRFAALTRRYQSNETEHGFYSTDQHGLFFLDLAHRCVGQR